MPPDPGERRGYRTEFYEAYVSGHQGEIEESRSRAALERQIIRHVPAALSSAILDCGCGQGQLLRALCELGYRNVTGIDLSREQVDLAHQLGTTGVHEADLFTFAVDHAEAYDCVVAVDVAEHFDRPQVGRFFSTLRSMLRPGGRVIIRTPNGSSPYHGRLLFGDVTHGTAYTKSSLRQVAAATGFDAVAIYPCRPAGTGFRQLGRRCLWSLVETLMILPLIAETGVVRGHVVTQNLIAVMTVGPP